MPRYTMIIDAKKCIGCFACLVACQQQNELTPANAFMRFEDKERGTFPNVDYMVVPVQCQHCQEAPCIAACPTTASYKNVNGLTLIDREKCMGCRRCVPKCPYNARTYIASEEVVQACNMFLSLVSQGDEPACVATCLTKARIFGDSDNPKGEFAKVLAKAKPLRADFGTKPTLLYIT
jgi:Fe-S-cluster-containing dehydrogenase component